MSAVELDEDLKRSYFHSIQNLRDEARDYGLNFVWDMIMRFPPEMIERVTICGVGGYTRVKDKSPWRDNKGRWIGIR